MLLDPVEIILWMIYFVSLYFTVFWFLTFLNKDARDKKRTTKRFPLVSIVIPAYNEEASIERTVKSALNLDYPKKKLEIIVVNDGSTDNTVSLVKAMQKTSTNIRLISQKNAGKGVALNTALAVTKGEYYICLDADSFVEKDALKILLAEFDHENVACVLPLMKAKSSNNLLQKIQFTEYIVNIFYKKIMASLDCVHVSPGPFSVYRTDILKKVGGFDSDNLTEDLEMTVRLQKLNYVIKQNMNAVVWTLTPGKFKSYIQQRKRWFKGGLFNAVKYKEMLFNSRWGDFGLIQLPILIISGIIGITLILTTIFYTFKPYVKYILNLRHVNFDLMTFIKDITLNIHILDLNYATIMVAIVLFFISLSVLYFSHQRSREQILKHGKLSFVFFIFFYFFLLGYVWIDIVKDLLLRKKQRW